MQDDARNRPPIDDVRKFVCGIINATRLDGEPPNYHMQTDQNPFYIMMFALAKAMLIAAQGRLNESHAHLYHPTDVDGPTIHEQALVTLDTMKEKRQALNIRVTSNGTVVINNVTLPGANSIAEAIVMYANRKSDGKRISQTNK